MRLHFLIHLESQYPLRLSFRYHFICSDYWLVWILLLFPLHYLYHNYQVPHDLQGFCFVPLQLFLILPILFLIFSVLPLLHVPVA